MVAPDYISGENEGREPPDDMHTDFLCKVYTHTHTHTHTHINTHTHMHTCTHTHIYTNIYTQYAVPMLAGEMEKGKVCHAYTDTHTHTNTCTHTHTHARTHKEGQWWAYLDYDGSANGHTHIHTYIHTHIHTYTHAHTHTERLPAQMDPTVLAKLFDDTGFLSDTSGLSLTTWVFTSAHFHINTNTHACTYI
jgi:hypothetical protein